MILTLALVLFASELLRDSPRYGSVVWVWVETILVGCYFVHVRRQHSFKGMSHGKNLHKSAGSLRPSVGGNSSEGSIGHSLKAGDVIGLCSEHTPISLTNVMFVIIQKASYVL